MPERLTRLVPFCGTIGLRWSEAVHLDDGMVDLAAGEVLIPRGLNKSRKERRSRSLRAKCGSCASNGWHDPPARRSCSRTPTAPSTRRAASARYGYRRCWRAGFAHRNEEAGGLVADFKFPLVASHRDLADVRRRDEAGADRVDGSATRDGGALIYRRYRHLFPSELRDAVGLARRTSLRVGAWSRGGHGPGVDAYGPHG